MSVMQRICQGELSSGSTTSSSLAGSGGRRGGALSRGGPEGSSMPESVSS
jgi:hypothetical protein